MTNQHLLSLDTNLRGRDFVVGDIHGMFNALDKLLDDANFNRSCDRLVCVGDLIDRGMDSGRVLDYLEQTWFYSILGNHEMMCIQSEDDAAIHDNWVNRNGGKWWLEVSPAKQKAIRNAFRKLPTVAEVNTNLGMVGVVHADVSARTSWNRFTSEIEKDSHLREFAVWSRGHFERYQAIGDEEHIAGVEFIVVGHTPVEQPLNVGNIRYIDTGATYINHKNLAMLTMLQIQPEVRIFQHKTREKRKWVFS